MAKTDQKTLDLIKTVARKKAEIALIERPNWKTNCSFSYNERNLNEAINLHTTSDLETLIMIAAFLLDKQKSYAVAADTLGLSSDKWLPDFTWQGHSAQDWIDDLTTRVKKIQIGTEKTKLQALEARLNQIISPELRAELELEAIASELV